jgi:hypothetical protein
MQALNVPATIFGLIALAAPIRPGACSKHGRFGRRTTEAGRVGGTTLRESAWSAIQGTGFVSPIFYAPRPQPGWLPVNRQRRGGGRSTLSVEASRRVGPLGSGVWSAREPRRWRRSFMAPASHGRLALGVSCFIWAGDSMAGGFAATLNQERGRIGRPMRRVPREATHAWVTGTNQNQKHAGARAAALALAIGGAGRGRAGKPPPKIAATKSRDSMKAGDERAASAGHGSARDPL